MNLCKLLTPNILNLYFMIDVLPFYPTNVGINPLRRLNRERVLEIPQYFDLFNNGTLKISQQTIDSLKAQIDKNPHCLDNINLEDFIRAFSIIKQTFSTINPSSIHVQVTSNNSLVVKAEHSQGNVYVESFFDEANGWLSETVVNIFKDKKQEYNNSGSLDKMVLAVKQHFDNYEMDYPTYQKQTAAYELSGSTFTTADF